MNQTRVTYKHTMHWHGPADFEGRINFEHFCFQHEGIRLQLDI